jgi:hypothetical protein
MAPEDRTRPDGGSKRQTMRQLRGISIGAAAAAFVVETGGKNLLLWTLVTIGTPVTTATFVYEVVQMRQSRLQHQAAERAAVTAEHETSIADPADRGSRISQDSFADADSGPEADLHHHLASMLIARALFIEIYGANPDSVSPAHRKIALDMLADDVRMFARLDGEKRRDLDGYLFDLQQDEAHLRVLHAQVATLAQ